MADHAEAGTWPLAGGILDQTQAFSDFVSQYRGVRAWAIDRAARQKL